VGKLDVNGSPFDDLPRSLIVNHPEGWERFRRYLCVCDEIELALDVSRMDFDESFLDSMREPMQQAFRDMDALEAGSIANPDENRRVGHYWLRAPQLAPDPAIRRQIEQTIARIVDFARDVHAGTVRPPSGTKFTDLLVIGIGGSALGPQFVGDALSEEAADPMKLHFIDNTDINGMMRVLDALGDRLQTTLVLVISKSGGTPETRNGMIVTRRMFERRGATFARHAVAVTSEGSKLDQLAEKEAWLARFPMWDWVGGRTSQTSAVGLLPAALQGLDIDGLLGGAAACDRITRRKDIAANPAALLALMWYVATGGRGERDMVVLPYKDRLLLFSRYLQQLVMESLGKGCNLAGEPVEQGITVYGNKGSTDQHAYVQQLREGVNNFFVTFIEVLEDGARAIEVDPGITPGDYLRGFLLGTRQALSDNGRESITITIERVSPFSIGVLVALFERAVGFYASLVGINAYHQPGVEAGKKAAADILKLSCEILDHLAIADAPHTAEQISGAIAHARAKAAEVEGAPSGDTANPEMVFKLLEALAANGRVKREAGPNPFEATYHRK
jgi:glucose-6-phosphate isomerase